MKNRVPIIEYSRDDYSIKCPQCEKPISLPELENEDYCSRCASYWNKTALGLQGFYLYHSKKLYDELIEYHKDD